MKVGRILFPGVGFLVPLLLEKYFVYQSCTVSGNLIFLLLVSLICTMAELLFHAFIRPVEFCEMQGNFERGRNEEKKKGGGRQPTERFELVRHRRSSFVMLNSAVGRFSQSSFNISSSFVIDNLRTFYNKDVLIFYVLEFFSRKKKICKRLLNLTSFCRFSLLTDSGSDRKCPIMRKGMIRAWR